jgi:hypothetical protein
MRQLSQNIWPFKISFVSRHGIILFEGRGEIQEKILKRALIYTLIYFRNLSTPFICVE